MPRCRPWPEGAAANEPVSFPLTPEKRRRFCLRQEHAEGTTGRQVRWRAAQIIAGALGRGVFPHQLSFLLELPARRLLLSPGALVTRVPLGTRDRVLEIGVGRIGLDRVRCVCADDSNLPFGQQEFDVICMVTAFGEVSRRREMVAEIHRILKPDGVLSISEHLPDPDFTRFSTLKTILSREGFAIDRQSGPFWAYTATFRKLTR